LVGPVDDALEERRRNLVRLLLGYSSTSERGTTHASKLAWLDGQLAGTEFAPARATDIPREPGDDPAPSTRPVVDDYRDATGATDYRGWCRALDEFDRAPEQVAAQAERDRLALAEAQKSEQWVMALSGLPVPRFR
jgi:hypothetical protein